MTSTLAISIPPKFESTIRWIKVQKQRMDGGIVIKDNTAECRILRDLKKGDSALLSV